jgi:hypothetical protein
VRGGVVRGCGGGRARGSGAGEWRGSAGSPEGREVARSRGREESFPMDTTTTLRDGRASFRARFSTGRRFRPVDGFNLSVGAGACRRNRAGLGASGIRSLPNVRVVCNRQELEPPCATSGPPPAARRPPPAARRPPPAARRPPPAAARRPPPAARRAARREWPAALGRAGLGTFLIHIRTTTGKQTPGRGAFGLPFATRLDRSSARASVGRAWAEAVGSRLGLYRRSRRSIHLPVVDLA